MISAQEARERAQNRKNAVEEEILKLYIKNISEAVEKAVNEGKFDASFTISNSDFGFIFPKVNALLFSNGFSVQVPTQLHNAQLITISWRPDLIKEAE